jgi:hypothetical protein
LFCCRYAIDRRLAAKKRILMRRDGALAAGCVLGALSPAVVRCIMLILNSLHRKSIRGSAVT